jgi:hypothetical protein
LVDSFGGYSLIIVNTIAFGPVIGNKYIMVRAYKRKNLLLWHLLHLEAKNKNKNKNKNRFR